MMFTFLKGEYRAAAIREYRCRLFTACTALALLLAVLLIGMAAPSYISLRSDAETLETEREAFSRKMAEAGQIEIESRIKEIKSMMAAVKEDVSAGLMVSVMDDVLSRKSSGISLSSISLERKKDGWAVSIAGTAASREDLVEFSKSLASAPDFSGIDLPVSSLARNKDVPFSMAFRSKF